MLLFLPGVNSARACVHPLCQAAGKPLPPWGTRSFAVSGLDVKVAQVVLQRGSISLLFFHTNNFFRLLHKAGITASATVTAVFNETFVAFSRKLMQQVAETFQQKAGITHTFSCTKIFCVISPEVGFRQSADGQSLMQLYVKELMASHQESHFSLKGLKRLHRLCRLNLLCAEYHTKP